MVNDVPANCSGSCSFQFSQEVTPLVSDVEYSAGNGALGLHKVRGGDGYGKGLPNADVCILLQTSVFREIVFPNSALMMSSSLEVCSTNTVLQRQDIRGSKGRGTAINLVLKAAPSLLAPLFLIKIHKKE